VASDFLQKKRGVRILVLFFPRLSILLLVEDGRLRGQKRRRRTGLPLLRRTGGLEAPSDGIQVAQTLSSIGTLVLEQVNEGGGGSGSGGGG
jgi:hypothetical protein